MQIRRRVDAEAWPIGAADMPREVQDQVRVRTDGTARVFEQARDTWVLVEPGDYVIRDARGRLSVCRATVFPQLYEIVVPARPDDAALAVTPG